MKKFFTAVSLQDSPSGLGHLTYQAVGNSRLQLDREISYPILAVINGYVQPGEDFRLIAVGPDTEVAQRNYGELCRQFEGLCSEKGLSCPLGVEKILIRDSQEVSAHVDTFQQLLDCVDDDDELFSCMTFGTKPQSQAMLLAVQYAYRVKKNASISCIVYGEVNRIGPPPWETGSIYDVTALTQLDEIVHILAERGVTNPKETLARILSL